MCADVLETTSLAARHPLEFTIQYPPRREYFQNAFRGELDIESILKAPELLLYLHIPFCASKCHYCNFAVDVRANAELHKNYARLLVEQIKRLDGLLPENTRVPGIDIGGGTPTILQAGQLTEILLALKSWGRRAGAPHFLSVETTPSIAASHPERLQALVEGGVERVSMGVQSTTQAVLADMNRKQQLHTVDKAAENIRKAGFRRFNADVIFGLPRQTKHDWAETVRHVISTGVDSVTTYDCLYRGKGRRLSEQTSGTPSPDTYGALYDLSYDMLTHAGFHAQYGSVNFSRIAGETGTSAYFEERLFKHTPYLGVGNYASSMVGNNWWFAPYAVNSWMTRIEAGEVLPLGDVYTLPALELMAKQILLSLNFGSIDTVRFERRFGIAFDAIYNEAMMFAVGQNWLRKTQNGYAVADGHFKDMHLIRSLFYTRQAVEWLKKVEQTHTHA
jgi:oxygen-independent coproporphyrinogen-3 oxidase